MKRAKRIILLLSMLLSQGIAHMLAQSEIAWMGGTVHDFGQVDKQGGAVVHTFRLRNVGTEPFVVLGVSGQCACTTATFVRHAVAPGDTASVVVRLDPTRLDGRFSQRLAVWLSGGSRRNTLFVKGCVVPAANGGQTAQPARLGMQDNTQYTNLKN